MDNVVRESAAELGLDTAEVRAYLTESLSFVLRPEELEGLEEFYRRAHHHGLILEPKPIEFWPR
jgi:predicted solute-binding protein